MPAQFFQVSSVTYQNLKYLVSLHLRHYSTWLDHFCSFSMLHPLSNVRVRKMVRAHGKEERLLTGNPLLHRVIG